MRMSQTEKSLGFAFDRGFFSIQSLMMGFVVDPQRVSAVAYSYHISQVFVVHDALKFTMM